MQGEGTGMGLPPGLVRLPNPLPVAPAGGQAGLRGWTESPRMLGCIYLGVIVRVLGTQGPWGG